MMDLIDRNLIGDLVDSNGNVHYEDIMNIPSLELPPVQPVAKDINVSCKDAIDRQAAIDYIDAGHLCNPNEPRWSDNEVVNFLKSRPSVQPEPSEMTDEQAILHLQSTGWMQNHDREMYESGLREQLADDSGGYDSLIPCEDTISRHDAIRWVKTECNPYGKPTLDFESGKWVIEHLKQMPSAQPEDCDTCKHGYFGDDQCERCRVRYPSHYERRTDECTD